MYGSVALDGAPDNMLAYVQYNKVFDPSMFNKKNGGVWVRAYSHSVQQVLVQIPVHARF